MPEPPARTIAKLKAQIKKLREEVRYWRQEYQAAGGYCYHCAHIGGRSCPHHGDPNYEAPGR